MLITEPKIIFIHIEKNGGTSIEKSLLEKYTDKVYPLKARHMTILKYNSICKIDEYFKFCIIRDPIERIWSMYNYDITNNIWKRKYYDIVPRKKQLFYYKFTGPGFKPTMTGFINYINEIHMEIKIYQNRFMKINNIKTLNYQNIIKFYRWYYIQVHSKTMRDHTFNGNKFIAKSQFIMMTNNDGNILVDKILKLENIDEDYKFIMKKFDVPSLQKLNTTNKLKRVTNKNYSKDNVKKINMETKMKICEMFILDYITFGYEMPFNELLPKI
jgi:hypothetical protein